MKLRRLFQFHLSTACLLTFVAAGFLWANCREHKYVRLPGQMSIWTTEYGFPINFYAVGITRFINDSPGVPPLEPEPYRNFHIWYAIFDLTVLLLLLFATSLICEWAIRRKAGSEQRKGSYD